MKILIVYNILQHQKLKKTQIHYIDSQRRWSEAAAQEVAGSSDGENTMRRWSMPWESSKLSDQSVSCSNSRITSKFKLSVPICGSIDRSRSVTPGKNRITFFEKNY